LKEIVDNFVKLEKDSMEEPRNENMEVYKKMLNIYEKTFNLLREIFGEL